MTEKFIITEIVLPTLEQALDTLPGVNFEKNSENLVLFGAEGAVFDSLSLVSFIFSLEEKINEVTSQNIKFEASDILNTDPPPFLNCINLTGFLKIKLSKSIL
jgi:hypothetical protein